MINKIALAGCGNVGTAFLELLHKKRALLDEKYGFKFEVTMVTDLMKGTVVDPNGIDLAAALDMLHKKNSFKGFPQFDGSFVETLEKSEATILAEVTPTDLKTGEPGLSHIKAALSRGINVTMTNKGPVAVAADELQKLAEECGAKLRYEGVVMSGTPLIDMLRHGMAGCAIQKIEGILNGTTNYILSQMTNGMTYAEALEKATELGYAEADPSGDVEGWDAAGKVAILAKIAFDKIIHVGDVKRTGITDVTPEKIKESLAAGYRVKLIAGLEVTPLGLYAYVQPKEIHISHPLASVEGATNAVTITTDNLGDVTLIGPGAGRTETAQALLTDVIAMA
ncbi:MAG: homoserine dehydrogenase [Synergistaceae bacterium]|nr:homoserine dehydrogenase [Synergistaceae bacterium]